LLRTLRLFAVTLALAGPVISAHSPSLFANPLDRSAAPLDACCDHGAPAPGDSPSHAGDCCPNGCHDCPLPCCRGSVALAVPPLPGLITLASAPIVPSHAALQPPASDPSRIEHPPRV
jgi:hypothetical protein